MSDIITTSDNIAEVRGTQTGQPLQDWRDPDRAVSKHRLCLGAQLHGKGIRSGTPGKVMRQGHFAPVRESDFPFSLHVRQRVVADHLDLLGKGR